MRFVKKPTMIAGTYPPSAAASAPPMLSRNRGRFSARASLTPRKLISSPTAHSSTANSHLFFPDDSAVCISLSPRPRRESDERPPLFLRMRRDRKLRFLRYYSIFFPAPEDANTFRDRKSTNRKEKACHPALPQNISFLFCLTMPGERCIISLADKSVKESPRFEGTGFRGKGR